MELSLSKLKPLSSGANSRIFLYGELSSAVVLKMVPTTAAKESRHLENQYAVLRQIAHDNILMALKLKKDVSVKLQEERKQNILVLEWAQEGSLLDAVRQKRFEVEQMRQLFCQTCQAVQYLHCNYIVHRDIKLENVLLSKQGTELTAKLADFGFASQCRKGDSLTYFNSYKGTRRGYMAPEIHEVLGNPSKIYDARKCDIFALGVLLFSMVLGKLPFQYATKQNKLYQLIAQEKYEQFWKEHSGPLKILQMKEPALVEDFKSLFVSMVKKDASLRMDIDQVLESEWVQGPRSRPLAL